MLGCGIYTSPSQQPILLLSSPVFSFGSHQETAFAQRPHPGWQVSSAQLAFDQELEGLLSKTADDYGYETIGVEALGVWLLVWVWAR